MDPNAIKKVHQRPLSLSLPIYSPSSKSDSVEHRSNNRSSLFHLYSLPMASTAAFSTSLSLPRSRTRPVLSPSPSQCQLRRPTGGVSFPFRLRTFKGPGIPRPPPLPLQILCISQSRDLVTKESWEKSILQSEIPVLVEFFASWCGPCRMVHRVIDEISAEYTGRLKCFVLNADNDPQIAEDYEIKAVPVVLLFKNGKKRDSVVGTMPKEFYVAAIERLLES